MGPRNAAGSIWDGIGTDLVPRGGQGGGRNAGQTIQEDKAWAKDQKLYGDRRAPTTSAPGICGFGGVFAPDTDTYL